MHDGQGDEGCCDHFHCGLASAKWPSSRPCSPPPPPPPPSRSQITGIRLAIGLVPSKVTRSAAPTRVDKGFDLRGISGSLKWRGKYTLRGYAGRTGESGPAAAS